MEKINLKDLFETNKEDAENSDFLNKRNVVYSCKNIINGKVYVGETNDTLYNRWCGNGKFCHKAIYEYNYEPNRVLYNAIRKYGTENFEVSILEEGFKTERDRKESEIKWIEKLKTYVGYKPSNGYNMNKGGNNCDHIHTKEVLKKGRDNNRKNHDGILAFQSEESRKKARETQLKKYGMLAMHLPENKEKAEKAKQLLKEKNGGVLPYNTKESIEKAQKAAPLHRMIGCIIRHLNVLKEKGLEINAWNYVMETNDIKHMWQQHIPHVLNKLDELRKIYKWNSDMEKIFSHISYDKNRKGINKILFKNEN